MKMAYDLEVLGAPEFYDELGDMGAPRRARRQPMRRPGVRRPSVRSQGTPLSYVQPSVQGVPARGARHQPLGLGTVSFILGSSLNAQLQAQPQRPFRGYRLVTTVARSGATAIGLLTITALNIGSDNQLVSSGAIPFEAFGPGAFDVWLDLAPASTSINITLNIALSSAVTGTDSIIVSAAIFGETVG